LWIFQKLILAADILIGKAKIFGMIMGRSIRVAKIQISGGLDSGEKKKY